VRRPNKLIRIALVLAAIIPPSPQTVSAYSVLAHESLIDAAWTDEIAPLIRRRFPSADASRIEHARAFAYGGSLIQDLGYYPFGNKFFSNLLHYVRSGDFVEALVRDAQDPDEYAFAIGALAHYAADNVGHPEAVNLSVPRIFPELQRKYGDRVTYVQAPAQHIITEFSFDVVATAGGAYVPAAYLQFIGFEVAKPLLERAFVETYGVEVNEVLPNEDLAINTYRFSVSQLFPALTRQAWKTRREEIQNLTPGAEEQSFLFAYTRADYERAYGAAYKKPGVLARILAFLYRLVPKVGPLKPLTIKALTPDTEALFQESVRLARERFHRGIQQARDERLALRNTDFDTGRPASHGEYRLADDTYAEWLQRLGAKDRGPLPNAIRTNIATFYGFDPAPTTSRDRKHWKEIRRDLDRLVPTHERGEAQ
jgi:hypothetical protein